MSTKKKSLYIILSIVTCFLFWKVSLCSGLIRAIPKEWVEYRNSYTRDSDPGIIPSGDVRCPLCHRHVVALYGGIVEDYKRDGIYTKAGNPVWNWEGCILDACWECVGCGKKFNIDGNAILRFPGSTVFSRLMNEES